ncbi:diguanylate cyclase [Aurantimonas sp. HBX-1]|uniref:GGDEF domain-containing protein n=1 Tax=Aurantimonas sp. HBX-1 TaxID=2906072 RepID=UPI001F325C4F|nr:diguanylate cyclase [Aurantimonas sp. HBX-1]UIJ73393.1 diguanylate cyclase [Aurantimonas sp. HBX-1]
MQALADPITLIHGIAMLALIALTYGFMARTVSSVLSRGVAVGLTFGLGAVSTMADPIVMQQGVIIDARGVILTLAGPFGGAVAAAIAAACAIAYRLWLGGVGAPVGCITILVGALVGVLFACCVPLRQGAYSLRQLAALAVFGSLHGFTVLLVLMIIPVPGLVGSLIPLCVLNFAGVVVLGSFLSEEGRRRHATRLLEKEAATDALTGLPNRRKFDAAGLALVRGARETDRAVALLMIDLDHFKRINDRWGHDVGDRVLRKVAAVIASEIRDVDLAARYGGEEIAVLLPDASVVDALAVSERIRRAVSANVHNMRAGALGVTVSIGVASRSGDSLSFSELFSEADRALYDAKRQGRDRSVVAPDSGAASESAGTICCETANP